MSSPIHPIEIRISIGANDKQGLAWILQELLVDLDRYAAGDGGAPNGCSGGWSGSWSITTTERDVSAEEYRRELEEWRKSQ